VEELDGGELVQALQLAPLGKRRVPFRQEFRVWSLLICVVRNASTRCAAFGVGENSEARSMAGAGERIMSAREHLV
jgi:hypothetical protein